MKPGDCEAASVSYAECGNAMRQAVQRAIEARHAIKIEDRVTERDLRVLLVVLAMTVSHSKLADETYAKIVGTEAGIITRPYRDEHGRQVRLDKTGMQQWKDTRKILNKLNRLGIIRYTPTEGTYGNGKTPDFARVEIPRAEPSRPGVLHATPGWSTTPPTELTTHKSYTPMRGVALFSEEEKVDPASGPDQRADAREPELYWEGRFREDRPF